MHPGRLLRYALQGAALCLAASAIVFFWRVEPATWRNLSQFRPGFLPLLFLMVLCGWTCNGIRTMVLAQALGRRLSLRQALGISLSTEFAIAATPGGVGMLPTRMFLQRRAGISYPQTTSMVAIDIGMDLVFFTLLAPFALFWLARLGVLSLGSQRTDLEPLLLAAVYPALLAGFAAPAVLSRRGANLCCELLSRLPMNRRWRMARRFARLRRRTIGGLAETGAVLRTFAREHRWAFGVNFAFASLQWCCRYGILPVLLLAFGLPVNPIPLMLVQGMLFLIGTFLMLPGGGGAVELLAVLILPLFAPASLAPVIIFLWRAFTYYLYLLGGGCTFAFVLHRLDRFFQPSI